MRKKYDSDSAYRGELAQHMRTPEKKKSPAPRQYHTNVRVNLFEKGENENSDGLGQHRMDKDMDKGQSSMHQDQGYDVPVSKAPSISPISLKEKFENIFIKLKSFEPPRKILKGDQPAFISWCQKIETANLKKFIDAMVEFADIFEMAFKEAIQIEQAGSTTTQTLALTPTDYADWAQIYLKRLSPFKDKLTKDTALFELFECIEDAGFVSRSQYFIQLHSIILSHCFNSGSQRIIQPQQRPQANQFALIQYAGLCRQAQAWFEFQHLEKAPEFKALIAAVKLGNGACALNLRDLYIKQLSSLQCESSILEVIDVFLQNLTLMHNQPGQLIAAVIYFYCAAYCNKRKILDRVTTFAAKATLLIGRIDPADSKDDHSSRNIYGDTLENVCKHAPKIVFPFFKGNEKFSTKKLALDHATQLMMNFYRSI